LCSKATWNSPYPVDVLNKKGRAFWTLPLVLLK
jgi:hypothetical protein